jgi:capsular polysaccharide biosynthesis protein
MSILNIDREKLPTLQLDQRPDHRDGPPDLPSHYRELTARTLLSIRRHWLLIVWLTGFAALMALIVIPFLPRRYSATSFVIPTLYSQEQGKVVALATVDATSIVNGEARLVLSDTILHAVVKRLEPELRPEAATGSGWLRSMFFPETRVQSRFDREMATLRNKVDVSKDTRSYLVGMTFTASSADEAARVVNSIAIEYVRDKWVQHRRATVIAAEAELTRQRAVNGQKHPRVVQAVDAFEVARADLKAVTEPDENDQDSARTAEGVRLALPNHTPTSPRGLVILVVSCLVGLLAGIVLAILRDRRGLEPFDVGAGRQYLVSGRQYVHALLGRRATIGLLRKRLLKDIHLERLTAVRTMLRKQLFLPFRNRDSQQQIAHSTESEPPVCQANNETDRARSTASETPHSGASSGV